MEWEAKAQAGYKKAAALSCVCKRNIMVLWYIRRRTLCAWVRWLRALSLMVTLEHAPAPDGKLGKSLSAWMMNFKQGKLFSSGTTRSYWRQCSVHKF